MSQIEDENKKKNLNELLESTGDDDDEYGDCEPNTMPTYFNTIFSGNGNYTEGD